MSIGLFSQRHLCPFVRRLPVAITALIRAPQVLSMRQPVPPVLRCSFYSPRLSLIRSGSLPSVYHAFSPQKSLCTQNGLLQASKHAQKSVRLLKYSPPPAFFVRRLFSLFFLLLLVHHLDLALFPQHIGGQDADGQHHDDKDAHKPAQHGAVACKACGEGEHRHDDQHR